MLKIWECGYFAVRFRSFRSSKLIHHLMQNALLQAKLPISAVQFVPTTGRAAVSEMLAMSEFIDLIIPAGVKA